MIFFVRKINDVFKDRKSHMKKREIILKAESLKKTYGQGEATVHALDDVSIKIYKGEILVILGSSGSGKSTLLNMLGGMDIPDSGKVISDERDICALTDKKRTLYRRKKVGFVFQFFYLLDDLTAEENVALAAGVQRNHQDVAEALEIVSMESRRKSYPSQLSGGEQQRISIARALVKKTDILFCDEPTGALDYETGRQILITLEELVRKHNKTVVIVTHTREIAKMADRVVRMRNGKIIEEWENETPVLAERVEW